MKTIINHSLAFLVMLMATIQASAYDFESDGIFYEITSEVVRNVAVTHGSSHYNGAISIPKTTIYNGETYTITSIGHDAFYGCSDLTSIEIPSSVKSIEYSAFSGCTNLTNIEIPSSVKLISDGAFSRCSSLTSIEIPNSVKSIGGYIFSDCTSLTSIKISNSVKNIYSNAFRSCTNLTSIEIPNSVTSIGNQAFYGCTSLTSIKIPNSVTSIDDEAFYGCTSLTSIEIPNSVTSIDDEAFYGCTSLTSIEIPNSVTSIGDKAFYGCSIPTIKLGSSLKSISSDAFDYCNALTSINVSDDNDNYSSIDGVLYDKDVSKLLIYPTGRASETSISLPATLKYINEYELSIFPELTSIYLHSETPPTYGRFSSFSTYIFQNTILYIPKGSLAAYENAYPWQYFWDIVEMDYSAIEEITAGSDFEIIVENGSISVNGNDMATVNVYDISGKLIYSGNDNVISGLNRGMYIVRVGNIARKVII